MSRLSRVAFGRLQKELKLMNKNPPRGICLWPVDDNLEKMEALIEGPPDSPFEGGEFRLAITIPERYPHEPPGVKFKTKIYHPNIDEHGIICLASLKPSPNGDWKPSINLETILLQIQELMTNPNVRDPLKPEIGQEFRDAPEIYKQKARKMTQDYAIPKIASKAGNDSSDSEEEE